MPHVLVISIGPVQDFIATARRSRDLWFGSWLLSELAKAAALEVVYRHAEELNKLVFPAVKHLSDLEPGSNFSVPNKIVVEISVQSPSEIGKAIGVAIQKRLAELRNKAFESIQVRFNRENAIRQIEDVPEVYWAAAEIQNGDYQKARNKAETLLAARKNTRNFSPVTWGGNIAKSSLDGIRETVFYKDILNTISDNPKELFQKLRIRPGEQLCGVGLLKRHGNRQNAEEFLSTSHVAALSLLEQFQETNRNTVQAYVEHFDYVFRGNVPGNPNPGFGSYDGRLLFEERLHEFFDKTETSKLEKAKEALRQLLKVCASGKTPLPYYALLHADGDRMGKAIDCQQGEKAHWRLSFQLSQFASGVKTLVEEHKGSLVYAGGDDVLAFVPLHQAIECAQNLADSFRERLKEFTVVEDGKTLSPTLSVGIAVGHHLDPLSDTLKLAREAEKIAKTVKGKNALAISVSKRSGSVTTVSGSWGDIDKRLQWLIGLHHADAVPDGAAYELRDLAHRLTVGQDEPGYGTLQAAMNAEAIRILRRKHTDGGSQKVERSVREKLENLVQTVPVANLADELIVARIFADAKNLSVKSDKEGKSK